MGGFLVCLPQLLYWHHTTGRWVYYSYTDEGFFWLDPKIWQVLFSGRKGWLLYSPSLALAVAGFFYLRKTAPAYTWVLPVLVAVWVYIVSCWWTWWYGGSFGMRPMIDLYALLGLPMLALFEALRKARTWAKAAMAILVPLLIYINLHYTFLFRYGVLHWDSLTYRAYWYARPGNHIDPKVMETLLESPNYAAAKAGKR